MTTPARIRVIDFETTGIPEQENPAGVIEVGSCDIVFSPNYGQWRVDEASAWWALCNPNIEIDPRAQAVHHIDSSDLDGAPPPASLFAKLMEGSHNAFAAHNAEFERKFFGGGDIPWICTLKVAYRILPDAVGHSNSVLRYSLKLPVDRYKADLAHRAGPDAYVTAHLLCHLLNAGPATVADMIRWSSGPALLPRVKFGKHFGAKWEDIPDDYLAWVARQDGMDRDVRATAKHHIRLREKARGLA